MRRFCAAAVFILAASTAPFGPVGIASSAEMKGHEHGGKRQIGKLIVERAWARASVAQTGAAYVTIRNTGNSMDRLVSVSSPVARTAELHTHLMDKGIVRMRPVEAVEVHPGALAVMRPGGTHIMLIGLNRKIRRGGTFPLTLEFAKSGKLTVSVSVMSIAAIGMKHGKDGAKKEMKHSY